MPLPHLLLDVDGVLIPFPAADGSTPPTHVRHTVLPAGRNPDAPVPIWLNPAHGPLLAGFLTDGPVAPVWCTSWRKDATTIVAPLLGLPEFPYLDLPYPQITTSHPNGYLWKRDHVEPWLGGSAVAWIDDDFTDLDHAWAAERTARGHPTLLVQPNPYVGLQAAHLVEIQEWTAHQVRVEAVPARDGGRTPRYEERVAI
ncbi:HAD domain-containing protein [Streptomyces sp. NBC_00091]|uniref:HAD domain-containing protein n=1 Tax=Streptomyces sp. NBC_00091 TaxID=2975648 RepID=UPI0022537E2D|nr:HAD domain-containing protein [Streptomyces sp. NBC_00091]MCX5375176.1 HAD domain-containing protein [Streptomyces sp. NBC_00091]